MLEIPGTYKGYFMDTGKSQVSGIFYTSKGHNLLFQIQTSNFGDIRSRFQDVKLLQESKALLSRPLVTFSRFLKHDFRNNHVKSVFITTPPSAGNILSCRCHDVT